VRSGKGRRLNRLRTERVERTFAHVCNTGGQRRQWSRGLEKVRKGYLLAAAGYNLGLILRKLFRLVKPRGLAGAWRAILRYLDDLLFHVKSVIFWKRPFPCRFVFALSVRLLPDFCKDLRSERVLFNGLVNHPEHKKLIHKYKYTEMEFSLIPIPHTMQPRMLNNPTPIWKRGAIALEIKTWLGVGFAVVFS